MELKASLMSAWPSREEGFLKHNKIETNLQKEEHNWFLSEYIQFEFVCEVKFQI